ncbi:hypothetical protein OG568_58390 (plasmid) [Streptomyces sp. NBC_01450]|uniref:hypothetical protein n=1 Tax=Streptomyces sp. NBC_01450 TaxID=2903871 RepID=UPI002E326277|nr:hypothetical protein [Streptomyces sp. NBC_01450]
MVLGQSDPGRVGVRSETVVGPVVLPQVGSTFAQQPPSAVDAAIARLRADLDFGAWHHRHFDLLGQQSMDYGYRLLIAGT